MCIHTYIHIAHNILQITEMQACHNVICQTHTSSCRLQVQNDTASYCEKSACGNRQHCSWNVTVYHHTFHRLTVSWLSVPLTDTLWKQPCRWTFQTKAIMSLYVGIKLNKRKIGELFKILIQNTFSKGEKFVTSWTFHVSCVGGPCNWETY